MVTGSNGIQRKQLLTETSGKYGRYVFEEKYSGYSQRYEIYAFQEKMKKYSFLFNKKYNTAKHTVRAKQSNFP